MNEGRWSQQRTGGLLLTHTSRLSDDWAMRGPVHYWSLLRTGCWNSGMTSSTGKSLADAAAYARKVHAQAEAGAIHAIVDATGDSLAAQVHAFGDADDFAGYLPSSSQHEVGRHGAEGHSRRYG